MTGLASLPDEVVEDIAIRISNREGFESWCRVASTSPRLWNVKLPVISGCCPGAAIDWYNPVTELIMTSISGRGLKFKLCLSACSAMRVFLLRSFLITKNGAGMKMKSMSQLCALDSRQHRNTSPLQSVAAQTPKGHKRSRGSEQG